MSLTLLFDREVTLRPMNVATEDARGNERRGAGEDVAGVPARRRQLSAEEDIGDRDQQARTFLYLLSPVAAALALTGRDRIVDGGEVLEVQGAPDVIRRRYRVHHVEARAYLIEG